MAEEPVRPGEHDTADAAAEALAEASAALERAAAARARAAELRRLALEAEQASRTPLWRRWGAPVAVAVAVVAICTLLALSGVMVWQGHDADRDRQQAAEYSAIARQSAVNIMSLDFNDAQGSVQRVIDNSTGRFKEEFSSQAESLVKALEKSKVTTEVTVDSVAVESMTDDSAVVLVAAQTAASNADDERKAPQRFRVAITLTRDDGQPKVSDVEFI
jgi:Mce-associated membrane protein